MKGIAHNVRLALFIIMYKVFQTFDSVLLTFDPVNETSTSGVLLILGFLLELAKFVGFIDLGRSRTTTYRVKFGYMVDSRSIIFSKLLEGLALSAAAAATGAAAAVAVAQPASVGLSPLTAAAPPPPTGATPAAGPPASATGALGSGGSGALDAGVLLSTGGWGWF